MRKRGVVGMGSVLTMAMACTSPAGSMSTATTTSTTTAMATSTTTSTAMATSTTTSTTTTTTTSSSTSTSTTTSSAEPRVSVHLRDAALPDVLQLLRSLRDKPVAIDASAAELMGCTRITLDLGDSVPVSDVMKSISEALAKKGLTLVDRDGELALSKAPGGKCPG